jgi:phosphohistidine phosphatase SixA
MNLTKTAFNQSSRQRLMARWIFMCLMTFFSTFAISSELADLMRQPRVVLMMRHAYAPGFSDPANFVLGQCATQRNLNQEGIEQAKKIGLWLKGQGVTEAKVFTSPWCRCVDTATHLNYGPLVTLPALGSTFIQSDPYSPARASLTQWMKTQLDRERGAPIIMVTHQVNITAYTGVNTGTGDMVIVQVNSQGDAKVLKTITAP